MSQLGQKIEGLILLINSRLISILLIFSLSSCFWVTTKKEGNLIREDIKEIKRDLSLFKKETESSVKELREVMEESTKLSANYGADIDILRNELAMLKGRLEEISYKLQKIDEELERRQKTLEDRLKVMALQTGVEVVLAPEDIPQDKETHWNSIELAFKNGEYAKMRALAKEFINRYPQDERCDDAQFNIGLSYLQEKKYQKALGQFQLLIDKYPKSDLLDDTLYYMGEGFLGIKDCDDAKVLWEKLIKDYPRSQFSSEARKKLILIQRNKSQHCH